MFERLGESVQPGVTVSRYGYQLTASDDTARIRLGQVAAAVISHGDITPYTHAIATGLFASAIMGDSRVEFDWLCRIAPPAAASELLHRAKDLLKTGETTAGWVAREILLALHSTESMRIRAAMPPVYSPTNPLKQLYEEHPCDTHLWRWQENNYLACLDHVGFSADFIAGRLHDVALNPNNSLPHHARARLALTGDGIDLGKAGRYRSHTSEEHALEEIEPALCAYAPERYAELMRDLAKQLPQRQGLSRHMLAWRLYEHVPVFDADCHHTLVDAWRAATACDDEEDRGAELLLYSMTQFDQSADAQFELLTARTTAEGGFVGYEARYRPIGPARYPIVESRLAALEANGPAIPIHGFLNYLNASIHELTQTMRKELLRLFEQGNRAVRGQCLGLFFHTHDQKAAESLIANGWRYHASYPMWWEDIWGSVLLSHFAKQLPFLELAARIVPEWWGYAVAQRGDQAEDLAEYARLLDKNWRLIAASCTYPDALQAVKVETRGERSITLDYAQADESGAQTVTLGDASWGGNSKGGSFSLNSLFMNDEALNAAHAAAAQRVTDLIESQRQAGNPWFASSFHDGQLDRVLALPNTPWRDWLAPLLAGTSEGRKLISLCRGFYEKLAIALLDIAPVQADQLFRLLWRHQVVRLIDGNSGLPTLALDLFAHTDAEVVSALRRETLEHAENDQDLFELALLARLGRQETWLSREIHQRLQADWPFDRARGLVLLGFSGADDVEVRLNDLAESEGDSWLGRLAGRALDAHRRELWAQTWFNRFLDESDRIKAWAAFRLFLACTDRRHLVWLPDTGLVNADAWKQDAYRANQATLKKAMRENEKKRKSQFLGEATHPRQMWPWMGMYLDED